jgi:hypothetical protein
VSRLPARPRRRRKAAKRFDPTSLRELVADGKTWNSIARTIVGENGATCWDLDVAPDGTITDILIEMELVPDGVEVTARWSNLCGGRGARGVFALPKIGEEFLVTLIDGAYDDVIAGQPLSSGSMPASLSEATEDNILAIAPEVRITDQLGGAAAVAMLAELVALTDKFNRLQTDYLLHTHGGVTAGGAPTSAAISLAVPPLTQAPTPTGSEVLRTK